MINPQDLYNKAIEAGEEWADKQYEAGLLEDLADAIKGDIAAELKANGVPISLISNLIKADKRHKEAMKDYRDAKHEEMKAKIKYDQVNRYMDNLRTKESTERQLAR